MNKVQMFLKSNSGNILTVIGSVGVIITSVLVAKETPRAMKMIEEYENEYECEIKPIEAVKVAWKAYIPAGISAISTILCIAGANYCNIRKQKAIMSAYMLLDNAFKEYRQQIATEYGEDKDKTLYKESMKKQMERDDILYEDTLFFEFNTMRYFETNMHKVMQAECKALTQFEQCGYLSLNDYYSYLGLEKTDYGDALGWSRYQMELDEGTSQLDFTYERNVMSNGLVCWNIISNVAPTMDHFCF